MVEFTPNMAGNSLIVLGISYIVVFAFQVYMLYLNWKQSKVKEHTARTNFLLEKILSEIRKKKK